MSTFKAEILKNSFKKSPFLFGKQLYQIVVDKIYGPTFLVFSADIHTIKKSNIEYPKEFAVKSYNNWLEIDSSCRRIIENKLENQYWGNLKWFDLGWTFWIGTLRGEPAIVSWTRTGTQSSDFFFPLGSGSILMWQTVTFVEFRGQGLLAVLLNNIANILLDRGVETIYGSCRDFSYPSEKGLLNAGFQLIGSGKKKRGAGTAIYFSKQNLFNLG